MTRDTISGKPRRAEPDKTVQDLKSCTDKWQARMGEKQAVSRGIIVDSGTILSLYVASTRLDSSRYLLD
jgi:hypothetical protein